MFNLILDVVKLILFDLDNINDAINFCLTNKLYSSLLKDDNFWRKRYRLDFGEEMHNDTVTSILDLSSRLIYVQRYTRDGGITYGSQYFTTLDVLLPRALKSCDDKLVGFFISLYDIIYSKVKDDSRAHIYFFLANSFEVIVNLLENYGYDIAYDFYQGAKFFHEKHLHYIKGILLGYQKIKPSKIRWGFTKYIIEGALIAREDDFVFSLIPYEKTDNDSHQRILDVVSIALKHNRQDFVADLVNKNNTLADVIPYGRAPVTSLEDNPIDKLLDLNRNEKIDLDEYRITLEAAIPLMMDSSYGCYQIVPRYDVVEICRECGLTDLQIAHKLDFGLGVRDIQTFILAEKYILRLKSEFWRLKYLKDLVKSKYCTYQKILTWLTYALEISPLPNSKLSSSYIRILYRNGYKDIWFYLIKKYRNNNKLSCRNNKLDKTPCEMKLLLDKYNTSMMMPFTQLIKSTYFD